MTTLVLQSGRRIRVVLSAKQIRERLQHPGYIEVGKARLTREHVALICVEHEVVEETKRRILSPRLGITRRRRPSVRE
jgi:hypothetical protein